MFINCGWLPLQQPQPFIVVHQCIKLCICASPINVIINYYYYYYCFILHKQKQAQRY